MAALRVAGCTLDDGVSPRAGPAVIDAVVSTNATNALSLVVGVATDGADSVFVRYGHATASLEGTSATVPVTEGGVTSVPVLGLEPETSYSLQAIALNETGTDLGELVQVTTGSLPTDLPTYVAGGSSPSSGYVVFAAGRYGVAIDNTGRVVWYHAFSPGPGLNFQPQPNGRYAARPPPSDPAGPAPWVEIDPLGNITRSLGCAGGLQPRFHDLIAMPGGDYWIMCDQTRLMDLSGLGGSASARVMGTVIQHIDADGGLLFQWSPFDHFAITDLEPSSRTGESVNWTHGNALDLDIDGNLVVSFRSLSEVTKIDIGSGAVIWRMGGLRNQFVFVDAPTPAFARQHGVRLTGPGQVLLLDNSGDAVATRAERYVYDAQSHQARLVASLGPTPAVRALLGGTTQDLPGGRALVAFGDGGRVQEYDAAGNVVWEIEGNAGYIFRAERIESLYDPGQK